VSEPGTFVWYWKGYWVVPVGSMGGSDLATTMLVGMLAVAGFHANSSSPVTGSFCTV
jgi:hypothetical protein